MRNLKTIEGKVKAILEKDEEARNDDMLWYLKVCNTCLKDTGAMPFAEVCCNTVILGFRALRAWAGHGGSCKRSFQSLWEAVVFRSSVPQAKRRTASTPKNERCL